jgi:hypothetical protein
MRATIVRTPAEPTFFTVPRVIGACVASAALIFGGITAAGWLFAKWRADPTQAPACFWVEQANYTPGTAALPLRGDPKTDRRSDKHSGPEVIAEAEAACKIGACPSQGSRTYRGAIVSYLSDRLRHTRELDRTYGAAGVQRASEVYSEPLDRRIEQGLRERYRAGLFQIKDFYESQDAIATLIYKNGAALRPCNKADRASR